MGFVAVEHADLPIVERVTSSEQLRHALTRQRDVSTLKLGARLLDLGLITQAQLNAALQVQRTESGRHLGQILLDLGLVSNGHLHQLLCEQLGIPLVELTQFSIDPAVLRLFPQELALECRVVPVCRMDGKLVVAVSDPLDPHSLERVRFVVQTPLIPVMACRDEIDQAIRTYYSPVTDIAYAQGATKPASSEALKAEFERGRATVNDFTAAVARLVNKMIADAHASAASHIHLDASAGAEQVAVRFRKDGKLAHYLHLPRHLRRALVTRIKAMAGIDVSARGRAQEGRINAIEDGPADLQLRVITVPAGDGSEHIAIKLIATREMLALDVLGFSDFQLDVVKQLIARPYGLMLVAGPANCGKTTTAHAILGLLNVPGTKIWTAESPIESLRPGLSQVEVNEAAGLDYPSTMHAIMRADPDVILIGDLRDRQTAAFAVEASLRGCRVISVLHGSSAADTVAQLIDLGLNTYSLSDAMLGIVAQRLARRLCLACRVSRPLTPSETDALIQEYCDGTQLRPLQVRSEWTQRIGEELMLYGVRGCGACGGTGYRGHIGLFELLRGGPAMWPLIRQRRPVDELAAAAIHDGMRTLKQDGIYKALAGHCDLLEARAATV